MSVGSETALLDWPILSNNDGYCHVSELRSVRILRTMQVLTDRRARPSFSGVLIGLIGLAWSIGAALAVQAQEAPKAAPAEASVKRKDLPTGAVLYSKPVHRGDRVYIWHGRWRDRVKAKKEAATAAAGQGAEPKPQNVAALGRDAGGAAADKGSLTLVVGDRRIGDDLKALLNGAGITVHSADNHQPIGPKELLGGSYDMAIIPADALATEWRDAGPDVSSRLNYIARLYTTEMHVLAPAGITDLRQLAGKEIAVDGAGASTIHHIFDGLGIVAHLTESDRAAVLDKLKSGASDAAIVVGGRSIAELATLDAGGRYHLIAVPYDPSLQDLYYPSRLTDRDYPNLIAPGEVIDTVAVGNVLATFDMVPGSPHYKMLVQATETFFDHFDAMLKPPRHSKWREVNLTAELPDWTRFRPAEDWLDRTGTAALPHDTQISANGTTSDPNPTESVPTQEQLFKDFLAWKRVPVK
jgi:uncharacterized protein